MRPNNKEDFWRFVNKTDGCWLWTGSTRAYRYGHFRFRGPHVASHRFSWALANGPIPEGMHVLHKCDNGLCVRPDHLFLGTHQDNMDDKKAKNRGNWPCGSKQHNAKLNEPKVLAIRAEYKSGARQIDLAAKFGIDQTSVSRIVLRKSWAHI